VPRSTSTKVAYRCLPHRLDFHVRRAAGASRIRTSALITLAPGPASLPAPHHAPCRKGVVLAGPMVGRALQQMSSLRRVPDSQVFAHQV
jgi:hypothetical protein